MIRLAHTRRVIYHSNESRAIWCQGGTSGARSFESLGSTCELHDSIPHMPLVSTPSDSDELSNSLAHGCCQHIIALRDMTAVRIRYAIVLSCSESLIIATKPNDTHPASISHFTSSGVLAWDGWAADPRIARYQGSGHVLSASRT